MASEKMLQEVNNELQKLPADKPEVKKKKGKQRRSILYKFADEVSFMGLSEAIKSKNWCARVAWLLIFLTCVSTAMYFVYRVFDEYLNNPTATKVRCKKLFLQCGDRQFRSVRRFIIANLVKTMASERVQQEVNNELQKLPADNPEVKKKKGKQRRSILYKFADEVSFMGLSEAIKSKNWCARVAWLLIFLTCVGTATYFVYRVFNEYFTDPTATKVKIIRHDEYPFPPLVLCVDTWLNGRRVAELGLTKEALDYGLSFLVAPYDIWTGGDIKHKSNSTNAKNEFEDAYRRGNFSSLLDFYNFVSVDAKYSFSFKYDATTSQDVIQVSCSRCYQIKSWNLEKVVIDRLLCYRISLDSAHWKLRHTSVWHEMVVWVPDVSLGLNRRKTYWKLYVNPMMKKLVGGLFISIQNGYTHLIKITSEHYKSLNKPRESCIEPNVAGRENYSAVGCTLDCDGAYVKMNYNCSVFNLDTNFERNLSEYCNTYYMKQWFDFTKKLEFNMQKCFVGCLPECNVWYYRTELDTHQSDKVQMTAENGGVEPVHKNVTMAKIFFINRDIDTGGIVTFLEVNTYSFDTLVGNIGGTCGIWIGASILTFVQLISFCSKNCFRHGKRKIPLDSLIRKRKV